jgi:hypothetical protein
MKKNKILIFFSLLILLVNCENEIALDDMSGKVVIEGNITDEAGPYYVKVTKSTKFFDGSGENFIENAKVVISDQNGQTETLVYDEDGVYETTNFHTQHGDTYTLSVTVEGNTYKAISKMPEYVEFSGLKQQMIYIYDEYRKGLIPLFTDPAAQENYYFFKSQVNDGEYFSYTPISDEGQDGQVNSKPLSRGFKEKDTVLVEMQCIDKQVYNYFKDLPQASFENNGETLSPINPIGNFSNGALGYFSAHTTATKTIIIE